MKRKYKPTIDDCIGAILARDEGMPYPEVLKEFELTPNKFQKAVMRDLGDFIALTAGRGRHILEAIASDSGRRKELFNMGEEFVKEQCDRMYGRIPGERQAQFYYGTFLHFENVKNIVYYSLVSTNSQLGSRIRSTVVEGIKKLPCNLSEHFSDLGLGGLMVHAFGKGKQNSPFAVLEVFDEVYQEKTGDKSLFDLTQETHLHEWGDTFQAQSNYWKNPLNKEKVAYHLLTESHPQLISNNRKEVIEEIKKMPNDLSRHFFGIGLGKMLRIRGKRKEGSPLAVLEIFDEVYQEKTGDKSLFDLAEKEHLHVWGDNFNAPSKFWHNSINVEIAIYHILTENHPKLASNFRNEIIAEVKKLPHNLLERFFDLGLSGLMTGAFEKGRRSSPLAVLEVFDKVYQEKTGDKSLFDLAEKEHLHIWGDTFQAPKYYWKDLFRIEEAAYHILTENHPKLASNFRNEIIAEVKKLPHNLSEYFFGLGLGGLMTRAFEKKKQCSPFAVLEVFDKVYQRKSGDKSLFDLTQETHLHEWGDNFNAPSNYLKNLVNKEKVAYHLLTENHPQMTSNIRNEVIEEVRKLPNNLRDHFVELGLGGLMSIFEERRKYSPLAVLEVFDEVYQRKSGDKSLFDLNQKEHLHEWEIGGRVSRPYWHHNFNVENVVYHVLTENHSVLTSKNRIAVIECIKHLPYDLGGYFHTIGLSSLMECAFSKGKQGSPFAVLEVFDKVYQGKTGDKSLFDLAEKDHLHAWGDTFNASRNYWKSSANKEIAIYHTLTESHPQLTSNNRKEVIKEMKKLPHNLIKYFIDLGFNGLMNNAFEKGKQNSPFAVLEVFDKVYREKTGSKSLFDLNQEEHLHMWGDNFIAPRNFWQNSSNVESAVYHTLTENHPKLASESRYEIIEEAKRLPHRLADHFFDLGLRGLMMRAFEKRKQCSPLAVLEVFDAVYRKKTGDKSLFDATQDIYLEIDGKNSIIRK